ncbi:MAG: LysR substrate-binding domain-containing protein [Pelagibacterium sp.]|uniref:LysR substrate-binding domain-containing protein n=1 Tax=Pelagibacterium sp. TaxID=1967288 RepID=UPI0032ED063C
MIKLSHFEAFNAVMLSGSMTAAATMMHTSQPNISRSISKLESGTGLKLFERVPGRLIPTSDGLALYEEVQRSFVGLSRLTEAAQRIHRTGSGILRIGAIQTLSLSLVPRAIKRFTDVFPQVKLSIQTAHSDVLSRWVREHTCDFAIVSTPDGEEGVERELLYTAEGVCIMHADHPLAARRTITPRDLAGERFITFPQGDPPRLLMDRIFLDANVEVSRVIETSYSSITCSLVSQGVGVAIVNPYVAREYLNGGLVARPFVPAPRHNAIMIFPSGKPLGRPVENFVEILRKLVKEEEKSIGRILWPE